MSTTLTLTGSCLIISFFFIATQAHDELEKRGRANMPKSLVTRNDINQILEIHNRARQDVGKDKNKRATNLLALEWDDDLARLAQRHTDMCQVVHDNMVLPDGTEVTQNLAKGYRSFSDAVQAWIDEREDYNMETFQCELPKSKKLGDPTCGHYLHAIWHSNNKVGCGVSKCHFGNLFACNYLPGTTGGTPVSWGAPCSKCNLEPGTKCDDGICRTCTPGRGGCRRYDPASCEDSNTDPRIDCKYVSNENGWNPNGNECKKMDAETVCEKSCGIC